ncbi:MAG TPA: coproporphyrinogen-III oxidase family protein, partial [Rhizomicrobium sp.]|nr:coproporphyrinogen-III oxidase family protein [Rhizomicrobium sp.]
LMSGHAVDATLDAIAKRWPLAEEVEITLEANPSSADAKRFRDYRMAGVNRLSLGVQALNDRDLKFLGRVHDAEEARNAANLAAANFERVSIDLIYARPDQTIAQWRGELRDAISLGAAHLSLYQLTIEEGTPFAALVRTGAFAPIDDDTAAALFETTQEITEDAGLAAYEISNHARPGQECRHNLVYWRYGCYAGVGPGAHGRLLFGDQRMATSNERLPERWLARVAQDGHGIAESVSIPQDVAAREQLLMNLRLSEGIDVEAYRTQWNREIDARRIAALANDGLVSLNGPRLAATCKGRLVLNALIAALAD